MILNKGNKYNILFVPHCGRMFSFYFAFSFSESKRKQIKCDHISECHWSEQIAIRTDGQTDIHFILLWSYRETVSKEYIGFWVLLKPFFASYCVLFIAFYVSCFTSTGDCKPIECIRNLFAFCVGINKEF